MRVRDQPKAAGLAAVALLASLATDPALAAGEKEGGFAAPAMADDLLRAVAGREDVTQVAQADQAATVTRNSVGDHSATGEVRIANNAFQNLSGLSVPNVNTGNNVATNASMNVNISLAPVP